MENEELIRLLEALPDGDWYVTPAEYPDARTVMSTRPDGRNVPVAADMTPEAAAFLAAAKAALPNLLMEVAEERAYYARLEAENERLHTLTHDLSSQLLDREQEIYEMTATTPPATQALDENNDEPAVSVFTPPLTLTASRISLASL